jgi:hypothetical protein
LNYRLEFDEVNEMNKIKVNEGWLINIIKKMIDKTNVIINSICSLNGYCDGFVCRVVFCYREFE